MDKRVYYKEIKTPLGVLLAGSTDNSLLFLQFKDNADLRKIEKKFKCFIQKQENHSFLNKVENQLKEYFQGKRREFDLNYTLIGTEFQKKCWKALSKIPYGKTISYSKQAEMIGNPLAVRAVANSNRLNPIAIVIPCHRVIGKNGKLTGYAGGINKKEFLLKLEKEI